MMEAAHQKKKKARQGFTPGRESSPASLLSFSLSFSLLRSEALPNPC